MTTLNTLFLPLLGGFLFYYISRWTSYFAANQPAQVVAFFSALAGLVLLTLASLTAHYCAKLPAEHTDTKLLIGLLVLPPLLFAHMLGYAFAALQSKIQKSRIRRLKALLALLGSLIAIAVVANVWSAALHFRPPLGVSHFAYWGGGLVAIMAWAIPWARISCMPLSTVLVRSTALVITMMLLLHWVLPRLADILSLWTSVTRPIGEEKAIEGVGIAFLACLLGPILAIFFNVIYGKEAAEVRLVKYGWASGLERLIYSAARGNEFVMLTMDDHKVYVGIVAAIFGNPRSKDAYIRILPLMSGFRDAKTHQLKFTTFYKEAFKAAGPAQSAQFEKVLPIERVASAGLFSPRYYRSFQEEQPVADDKSPDAAAADHLDKIAKSLSRLEARQAAAEERRRKESAANRHPWRRNLRPEVPR